MNKDTYNTLSNTEEKASVAHYVQVLIERFSLTERLFFLLFAVICVVTSFMLAARVNNAFLVQIPSSGGNITEGVVSLPRFINPLLATSETDKDLTSLVYSGLLKATPDGRLINDLSEYYTISPDGKTYTFVLKKDIYFHDGTPVTAEDVKFTVEKAQDPLLKSARRASWDGVEVEVLGEKEISFALKQPYAPFLENATLGILPKHVWTSASAEQFPFSSFNIEPIGSGPYIVTAIKRNSGGLPIRYHLTSFKRYALGEAYIKEFVMKFYSNEDDLIQAFNDGSVDAVNGISPAAAKEIAGRKDTVIKTSVLPRIFGVFFNQNQQTVFVDKEVRRALDVGLNKERIVEEVLKGYGSVINSPIPPEYIRETEKETGTTTERTVLAQSILEKAGWKVGESGFMEKKGQILQFSLSTSDVAELKQAAEIIQEEWGNIGVLVDLKIFESGDLNQNIIRPRKYDALLFGEIVGRDLDLFPFWHSSQRNDPGLNITLYANITSDKLLEDARITLDPSERLEKYQKFEIEVKKDIPAIFIYSPEFIYAVSDKIKNIELGKITVSNERFLNIHNWYVTTEKVWQFFVREEHSQTNNIN